MTLPSISTHLRHQFHISHINSFFRQTWQSSDFEVLRVAILNSRFVLPVHCAGENLFFVENAQGFEAVFPTAVDRCLDCWAEKTVAAFGGWETRFSSGEVSLEHGEVDWGAGHTDLRDRGDMTESGIELGALARKQLVHQNVMLQAVMVEIYWRLLIVVVAVLFFLL